MKKFALLLIVFLLVGCGARPESDSASVEGTTLASQDLDYYIADLEYQVNDLTESLEALRSDYATLSVEHETLKAQIGSGESVVESSQSNYLCPNLIDMRYDNSTGAIAIVEGWFAVQPQVRLIQGTYSTPFWDKVSSRIHTIRYISEEDGLTTTDSFLIMFEEAGWMPGTLWMTQQCWLDPPY